MKSSNNSVFIPFSKYLLKFLPKEGLIQKLAKKVKEKKIH